MVGDTPEGDTAVARTGDGNIPPGDQAGQTHTVDGQARPRYDTPTGQPCPRSVRPDGSVIGDGACHECGLGAACPLRDPWADGILD